MAAPPSCQISAPEMQSTSRAATPSTTVDGSGARLCHSSQRQPSSATSSRLTAVGSVRACGASTSASCPSKTP